jgi:hypothetical protein
MFRTAVAINDHSYSLALGADVPVLKDRIEDAIGEGGGFVELRLLDDRSVSVLITPVTRVVFSTEQVEPEQNGDDGAPDATYGAPFDL